MHQFWVRFWGHEERGCTGRHHRRGHGFGLFAAAFGEGIGGRHFAAGRKLASGDLQLLVLALLEEKPRHGYEIIKALEEYSGGFYAPSPGMVYPALTYLEELGYAVVEVEGAKKLYRITETGKTHLQKNREVVDTMMAQLARVGQKMERVRQFFAGEEASEGDKTSPLYAARRELRSALREKGDASAEERQRMADILLRAAQEIRNRKS